MVGTIVNAAAVVGGTLLGVLVKGRLPEKIVDVVFQGIGLFTLILGADMALKTQNFMVAVSSVVLGAVCGGWMDIDKHMHRLSNFVERRMTSGAASGRFTEGVITSTMLFCVGSMSILGAVEDGTGQTPMLLYTKSIMDGISSIAFAASFGLCIAFSAVPLLIYQGAITLFAGFVMRFMSDAMIADMTGVGGILLVGMGLNILNVKNINVVNMLPAIVFAVLISYFV